MSLIIKTTGFDDYLDRSGGAWLKLLIMGTPDTGKTRSASFWPKPIFADCEDGRMSIADRAVPYARIRSTADMTALLGELRKDAALPREKRKYLTLVIDTGDAFQRIIISERLLSEKKESLSGWADWGYLDAKMGMFIEAILNLPINIIFNLHVKEEVIGGDNDETKTRVYRPRLKGDIKDSILQEFDLIGQMETSYKAEKGERVRVRHIRWHNEPNYPALKDRSGRLPRFTDVDFSTEDYSRVFNAITGGVDDLPTTTQVDEIEVVEDATPPPAAPDAVGGPLDPGKLPQKRAAAKTAKKAPAKKAAAPEPQADAPADAPAETSENGRGTEETPVEVSSTMPAALLAKLDHAHTEEGICVRDKFGTCKVSPVDTPVNETPSSKSEREEAAGDAAVQTAVDGLGATVIGEEINTPEPGPVDPDAVVCGSQPSSHEKFEKGHPGCGKDLSDQNPAKVNLSLLRAKVRLCSDCHEEWKAQKVA